MRCLWLRTLGRWSLRWQMTWRRGSSTGSPGSASSPRRYAQRASRQAFVVVALEVRCRQLLFAEQLCMQRAPMDEAGDMTSWSKARLKFLASSVLHYLPQRMPVPRDLQRTEAAAVASLLAAPMWAFTPDAVASVPRNILRTSFRTLPMVADASFQRLALRHPELAQIRDMLAADAGGDEAFLLLRSPR